jgi:hypothetical protein
MLPKTVFCGTFDHPLLLSQFVYKLLFNRAHAVAFIALLAALWINRELVTFRGPYALFHGCMN